MSKRQFEITSGEQGHVLFRWRQDSFGKVKTFSWILRFSCVTSLEYLSIIFSSFKSSHLSSPYLTYPLVFKHMRL